jgi:hypothetical protein
MKLRARLILCLSVSLWTGQTNAGEIERIIRKGDRAHIDAVLVPNDRYRYYQEQVELNDRITAEWKDCNSKVSEHSIGEAFMAGTITGSIIWLIIGLASD